MRETQHNTVQPLWVKLVEGVRTYYETKRYMRGAVYDYPSCLRSGLGD
ncbi:MAG: hypothetical protein JXB14_07765 [Candidatus Altiarchaeota archaeon]|nr:hypothetical protein [Candidatus Altiarchaeota archaeon]